MIVDKKLIHFKTKENFNKEVANGKIFDNSIVFIQDTKEIFTHDTFYDGSSGRSVAYSEVNHGTNDTTFTLTPNIFHVWGGG